MISFKQFLKEGMIANPPKLLKDITDFIVYVYLAYVKDNIEEHLSGKEYNEALQLLKRFVSKYKLPMPTDSWSEKAGKGGVIEHSFKLDFSDLPDRYLDKLKKLGTDISKLHEYDEVIAELDFTPNSTIPTSGEFNPGTLSMTFSMKHNSMLLDSENTTIDNLHQLLYNRLPFLVGIVDHETAHMVQFLVLRKFHAYNVHSLYTSGKIDDENRDDYYNSQVEFDPQIRSEAAYFKGVEELSKEFGLKEYDKHKALEHFTFADGTKEPRTDDLEKISFTRRSPFFGALKRKNPEKWKKAVKLISQMV
jgi:hypothetical protein